MGLPSLAATLLRAVALACGLAAWASGPSRAEAPFDAVDAYILREMAAAGIPGAALAIVKDDRIVHSRGFGIADPSGRPVRPDTPFIVGSTGKSMTALAVMQLAEAGRIDLDAPVQRYLPWFRLRDTAASARITVRHLLNQTSGIPTAAGLVLQDDPDEGDGALERHVRRLADFAPSGQPGERFEYSNGNYTTLGLIVQAVSGLRYEDYIRQRIFEPLGMRRSFTSKTEARQAGLATGFRQWLRIPVPAPDLPYVRGELPAGYHISTAEDMARLLIAQMNGGLHSGRSVLSARGIAELQRPAAEMPNGERYAMGWRVGSLDGVPVIAHGGAVPNYLSNLVMLPDQRWGVVLLANTSNALFMARTTGIGNNVARLLIGRPTVEPAESPIPWLLLALTAGLALLHLGLGLRAAGRRLGRRRDGLPKPPPRPGRSALLLLLNAGLLALLWLGLPRAFGASLPILLLFQPDLGWLVLAGGLFSLAWAAIHLWSLAARLARR